MVDMPLTSVIVPGLNRAHFLIPTIDSILQQDYPNLECIVIDGGSTDGTVDILRQYGERIKWISEPDKGHADAINKGWRMSKGEILSWLNADDIYVIPDAVSKAVTYLQKNQQVDVVYGDYSEISEQGEIIRGIIRPPDWDLVKAVKYCQYIVPQAASFMHRSILEKVGWLDAEFGNGKDHELWLRIGMAGTIKYAPIHVAYVRQGRGLSQRLDMGAAKVRVTEKFFQQPNLPPPFNSTPFRRKALSNSYLVGGIYIWVGTKQVRPMIEYMIHAFMVDPLNSPYILAQIFSWFFKSIYSYLPRQWRLKIKGIYQHLVLNSRRSYLDSRG